MQVPKSLCGNRTNLDGWSQTKTKFLAKSPVNAVPRRSTLHWLALRLTAALGDDVVVCIGLGGGQVVVEEALRR